MLPYILSARSSCPVPYLFKQTEPSSRPLTFGSKMAEVAESHSNGNGKHSLDDDDSVDSPVKAKLLKAENGDAVAKQPSATNKTNLKDDDTSATADSTPAVDDEKSVEASNDSIGVAALQAGGDQSNNKSDFNESESAGAVSTGGVGDESNTTNTNDLGNYQLVCHRFAQ